MKITNNKFKGFDPKKSLIQRQKPKTPDTTQTQTVELPKIAELIKSQPKTPVNEFTNYLQQTLGEPNPKIQQFIKEIQKPNPKMQEINKLLTETSKFDPGPQQHLQKIEFPELKSLEPLESKFRSEQLWREFQQVNKEFEERQNKINSQPKKVYSKFANSIINQKKALKTTKPLIEQQEMVSNLTEMARGLKGQIEHMQNQ